MAVQPTVAFLRRRPEPLYVIVSVDPLQDPDDVAVGGQGRMAVDGPAAVGIGLERIEDHLDPTCGLGMTQTRVVVEDSRVGAHENS